MSDRKLAYIAQINDVAPIPGYDRIEVATVLGWHCVVPKGLHAGDLGVYFEIDSLLPSDDPRFAFCEKYKYKVKTRNMCKGTVLSQGLFMPLTEFPELAGYKLGDDVTAALRVTYYEPEDNVRKAASPDKYKKMAARHKELFQKRPVRWLMRREWGRRLMFFFLGNRKTDRGWPSWVKVTKETRLQNMPWILGTGDAWTATENVDGMSATYTIYRHHWPKKNEFIICSRNVAYTEDDENTYTEIARKYKIRYVLEEMLRAMPAEDYITIQGEIYGAGVQKRDYGKAEPEFMAFNLILSTAGRLPTDQMELILDVPVVPILDYNISFDGQTVDDVIAGADGISRIDGGMRKGIVYRSFDGQRSFKAVSNEYLLKYH